MGKWNLKISLFGVEIHAKSFQKVPGTNDHVWILKFFYTRINLPFNFIFCEVFIVPSYIFVMWSGIMMNMMLFLSKLFSYMSNILGSRKKLTSYQ